MCSIYHHNSIHHRVPSDGLSIGLIGTCVDMSENVAVDSGAVSLGDGEIVDHEVGVWYAGHWLDLYIGIYYVINMGHSASEKVRNRTIIYGNQIRHSSVFYVLNCLLSHLALANCGTDQLPHLLPAVENGDGLLILVRVYLNLVYQLLVY